MQDTSGRKLIIFLKEGLPKGLREARIDQWSGKAICGPRNKVKEIVKYPETESCCLYFLVGQSEDGEFLKVYVGEADGFANRIANHNAKEWWESVVVFFSQDKSLTKSGIQYLESICVEQLKKASRCKLENGNIPTLPSIPKEDVSGLEYFYEQIILIMPLFGYDIFIQKQQQSLELTADLIKCSGKDADANGILLDDGKVKVLKGSKANKESAKSFEKHNYKKIKDELIGNKILIMDENLLIFADDYVFDSPSAAAAVVLGRSASGPREWKMSNGKPLSTTWDNTEVN